MFCFQRLYLATDGRSGRESLVRCNNNCQTPGWPASTHRKQDTIYMVPQPSAQLTSPEAVTIPSHILHARQRFLHHDKPIKHILWQTRSHTDTRTTSKHAHTGTTPSFAIPTTTPLHRPWQPHHTHH